MERSHSPRRTRSSAGRGTRARGRRAARPRLAHRSGAACRDRRLRLLEVPAARQPGADAAGQRIRVAVAHVGKAVVEVVKVDRLVDQLRLRLDQPAVAEVERIAALDRGGQAPAVGLAIAQAARCPSWWLSYQVACSTPSRYQSLGPKCVQ